VLLDGFYLVAVIDECINNHFHFILTQSFLLSLHRNEKGVCHDIVDSSSDLVYGVGDTGVQLCKDGDGSGV
jgi:hypothetical protein